MIFLYYIVSFTSKKITFDSILLYIYKSIKYILYLSILLIVINFIIIVSLSYIYILFINCINEDLYIENFKYISNLDNDYLNIYTDVSLEEKKVILYSLSIDNKDTNTSNTDSIIPPATSDDLDKKAEEEEEKAKLKKAEEEEKAKLKKAEEEKAKNKKAEEEEDDPTDFLR